MSEDGFSKEELEEIKKAIVFENEKMKQKNIDRIEAARIRDIPVIEESMMDVLIQIRDLLKAAKKSK